jgi:hypothetical protein
VEKQVGYNNFAKEKSHGSGTRKDNKLYLENDFRVESFAL